MFSNRIRLNPRARLLQDSLLLFLPSNATPLPTRIKSSLFTDSRISTLTPLPKPRQRATLTCNRTRQSIQLIAHQILVSDAIYSHHFPFRKVFAKDSKVVVVNVPVLRQRLHESNDILDRLSTEGRAPVLCNWRFGCILPVAWGIGPVVCKPEVVFAAAVIRFFEDVAELLKNRISCLILLSECLLRTSLDTSARTKSAKWPLVHAVLTSLGPSWAMVAREVRRADGKGNGNGEYAEQRRLQRDMRAMDDPSLYLACADVSYCMHSQHKCLFETGPQNFVSPIANSLRAVLVGGMKSMHGR